MDFEKLCTIFTMQEPYYGILLSSMARCPTRGIKLMAVGRSGNVFKLYYNPDMIAILDDNTILELLRHEVLHVALNHFCLWDDTPTQRIHDIRNIATDIEVNSYIHKEKISYLKLYYASDFGWDERLGAREYFKRLMAKCARPKPSQKTLPQQPQQEMEEHEDSKQKVTLSENEAKVYNLRKEGKSIDDIANELTFSPEEVKIYLSQARRNIITQLKRNG